MVCEPRAVLGRHGSVQRSPLLGAQAALGREVRLIAPQFAAPYRKGGKHVKNDRLDAEAICEAAGRLKRPGFVGDHRVWRYAARASNA
jgi:hypothetical protein